MIELFRVATVELARFLAAKLPELSADWWPKHVVDRLSFQQQRIVREQGHESLQQLDFAALLRVLDQNWNELSNALGLPREGRSWVKELQTVRNKWAHLSAESMPASETYRDADTLGRLLAMLEALPEALGTVESAKVAAVAAMAKASANADEDSATHSNDAGPSTVSANITTPEPASSMDPAAIFKVGDLVALRSNPAAVMPVIEVLPGTSEYRYCVFQNNAKVIYYESQLQEVGAPPTERRMLAVPEMLAYLTSLQILSPSTANLFSLRLGRIQFVPYQYRPVLKLIRSDRPRLLIADEVGVGKTAG